MHGLEVFPRAADPDPRRLDPRLCGTAGRTPVEPSVADMLAAEPRGEAMRARLKAFRDAVMLSKLRLLRARSAT